MGDESAAFQSNDDRIPEDVRRESSIEEIARSQRVLDVVAANRSSSVERYKWDLKDDIIWGGIWMGIAGLTTSIDLLLYQELLSSPSHRLVNYLTLGPMVVATVFLYYAGISSLRR